jgi:hypothetical protein
MVNKAAMLTLEMHPQLFSGVPPTSSLRLAGLAILTARSWLCNGQTGHLSSSFL